VTHTDEGTPTFERDIKRLFRESDRTAMVDFFDLWSYDDVKANAHAIVAAVRGGVMPCDAPWPGEEVNLLQRWIDGGMPETKDPLPG
jgi:hypothetical protein